MPYAFGSRFFAVRVRWPRVRWVSRILRRPGPFGHMNSDAQLLSFLVSSLGKNGWSDVDIDRIMKSCLDSTPDETMDDIMQTWLVGEEEVIRAIKSFRQGRKTSTITRDPQTTSSRALGMFRHGRPFKQSKGTGRPSVRDGDSLLSKDLPNVMTVTNRTVINCHGCGYIYHLQLDEGGSLMATDSKKMLESRQCCFCGDPIGFDTSMTSQSSQATKDAYEFKDRLLQYDQQSTKRTTVCDDQSDFFLVESNVWLSAEEKEELHKQVVENTSDTTTNMITIDLLGRRVLISEANLDSASLETTAGDDGISIHQPASFSSKRLQ